MGSTGREQTAEGLAARFDRLWAEAGDVPPDLDAFLAAHPSAKVRQRAEVVRVDQRRRWASGNPRALEEYFREYPDLAAHPAVKLALVVAEFRTACRNGVPLDPSAFVTRFSDVPSLLSQIQPGSPAEAPAVEPPKVVRIDGQPVIVAPPSTDGIYDIDVVDIPPTPILFAPAVVEPAMVPSARSDPEFKPIGGADESEKPRSWVVRKLYQRGNGYHKDPCIRTLPWIWEWAIILLRTRADGWTTRQQRMMGAATRFYLASALGLSVLVAGVGVGIRLLRPVPPAPVVLPVIETVDRSGLETYAALLADVTTELNAARFHKANEILDRADAKLRHWEWRYLKGICDIWMSDLPAKESSPDTSPPKQPGTGRVNSVYAPRELPPGAPSPDGVRLVTVGTNEVVSTEDGHVLKALNKISVISFDQVAYSPNGRRYVTIDRDRGMRFWDATTDMPLGESRKINERIIQMTFSADGSRLITVGVSPGGEFNLFGPLGNRAVITVWDPERGGDPITSVYGLEHRFRGRLAVSHDGSRFAVGSLHDSARVYKTDRGTVSADLEGHTQPVFGLVFSPDGRHLIASSLDLSLERKIARGEIKVWDLEKSIAVQEFPGPALGTMISPDGNLLFAAEVAGRLEGEGGDRSIRIFDFRTGELSYEIPGPIRGLAFTPDGKRFVALMKDTILIRETTTGTEVLSLPIKPPEPRGRIAAGALMFSSDGLRLLLPGRSDDKRKATEPTRVWYAPSSTQPGESHPEGQTSHVP